MSEKESLKRIRLTVEGGPTREFPGDRAFVIGRSQNVDFSIPHPNLSREHVRISLKDGDVWLEDLGSANGTFVQGQKLPPKSVVKIKPQYRVLLGTGSNVIITVEAVESSEPLPAVTPAPMGDLDLPAAHEHTKTSRYSAVGITPPVQEFEVSKTMTKSRPKLELDFPKQLFPAEAKKEKVAELRIMEAKKQRVIEDIQYKEREVDDLRSKVRTLREECLKLKEQTESYKKEIQPLETRRASLQERVEELDATYEEKIDSLESGFVDLKQTLEESHSLRMARADKDYKEKMRRMDEDYARKLQELENETQSVRTEGERLRDTLIKEKRELEENLKRVRTESESLEAERRLAKVRIDTDIAQLQGMKMKLENELENIRRKHEKVTIETNASIALGRSERTKLEGDRKALAEIHSAHEQMLQTNQIEKENFKKSIEEIKQSESKNIRRIEELRSTILDLEVRAKGIEGALKQAEEDASSIRAKGHEDVEVFKKAGKEKAEQQLEEILKKAEAQAHARIEAAEAQAHARMEKAALDSREILERAQNDGIQYYEEKKMTADGLLAAAQSRALELEHGSKDQAERSVAEANALLDAKRKSLETEMADLRKRSDQEIRQVRQNAITDIEAAKERESKEFSARLKGRVKEIGDQVDRIVGSKLAAQYGVNMDPVSMKAFSDEIHQIVETVIGVSKNGISHHEKTMSTILPVNNQAQERVVRYWKKMGIAASVIFVLIVGRFTVPEVYTSIGQKLSSAIDVKDNTDAVVKRMLRERQQAMTFVTQQDQQFRDNYTDNILYTEGFIEMKEDSESQKVWTLGLNRFFQSDLGLTEKAIVQFGSAEGRMIRDLIDLRKGILPLSSVAGIQKMRDMEAPIVKEMRFIVRTEVNWRKFQAFHREFYTKYTQTFLNRAPASKEAASQ